MNSHEPIAKLRERRYEPKNLLFRIAATTAASGIPDTQTSLKSCHTNLPGDPLASRETTTTRQALESTPTALNLAFGAYPFEHANRNGATRMQIILVRGTPLEYRSFALFALRGT
jgi:hypothetical protein